MEVFNLTVEEKNTVWERLYVTVEAESLEEAIAKCNRGNYDVYDSETLYETMEPLAPTEESPVTLEVYDENNDILFDNNIIVRT